MRKIEITQAAYSLFAERGYYNTSMQNIADYVGINKATLYFHFISKSALFSDVLNDTTPRFIQGINDRLAADKSNDFESKLRIVFLQFVEGLKPYDLMLWKLALVMSSYSFDSEVQQICIRMIAERDMQINGIMRSFLRLYYPECLPVREEKILLLIATMIRGFTDWMLIHQHEITKEYLNNHADLAFTCIWDGILRYLDN